MYYVENDDKEIVLFDSIENNLINTKLFKPQYKDLEIKFTDKNIVRIDGKLYFEDSQEALDQAKAKKIEQNDINRDNKLNGGVEYRGVLFDSDTDQKTNLMYMERKLSDSDIITWYGMGNEPLSCNKEDLNNIGNLIVQLDTYCWTRNAEIKQAIAEAKSLEELEAIGIQY